MRARPCLSAQPDPQRWARRWARRWVTTLSAAIIVTLSALSAAAQDAPEPWRSQHRLGVHPPLLAALDALFAEARARDEAAFRARFTPESIDRLKSDWADPDHAGSWATMMASLVTKDGASPHIVEVNVDDAEAPSEATVVIAIDGRRHTLYLTHDAGRPIAWMVDVRERSGVLNLDITLAAQERSIAELSFGSALGAPGQYVLRYDDDVNITATASLWIIVELFALPWMRLGAIYDLPLGLQVLEVGGELVHTYVPSRLLAGVTWTPVYVDFAANSRLEAQLMTFLGLTLEGSPRWVPMICGRAAFLQNAYEGADVYLGAYYQGGVNVLGIIYGVGYRF